MNYEPYGWWINELGQSFEIMDKFGHKQFMKQALGNIYNPDENILKQALDNHWIRVINDTFSFMIECNAINENQIKALYNIYKALSKYKTTIVNFIVDIGSNYYNCNSFANMMAKIKENPTKK